MPRRSDKIETQEDLSLRLFHSLKMILAEGMEMRNLKHQQNPDERRQKMGLKGRGEEC